jgi:2-polyprenyl-3-methyl-5-hydroxy-6-metoxy-1,4-benzoquinol methylase
VTHGSSEKRFDMDKSEKFFDMVSRRSRRPLKELCQTSLKTIEATKRYLESEDAVLDVGCGPGSLTTKIAERVASLRAIDISAGMIAVAKLEADQRGIRNIEFTHSGLHDEGLKNGSFNVVVAFNVLHYVESVEEVSRTVSRLLKPGGLFISSTACLAERRTLLGGLALFASRLGLVPDMKSFRTAALERSIADGGFDVVASEKLSRLPDCFVVASKEPAEPLGE